MWFLKSWRRKPAASAAPRPQAPGRHVPAAAFLLACGVETVIEDHLVPPQDAVEGAAQPAPAPPPDRTRRAA
jgi:hypothetical protein